MSVSVSVCVCVFRECVSRQFVFVYILRIHAMRLSPVYEEVVLLRWFCVFENSNVNISLFLTCFSNFYLLFIIVGPFSSRLFKIF